MEEIRFDIVIHTCLFLHVFFGRVWAPFGEGLGTVLGRFWGRSGASWPLLGGLLALFLATLKFKRAQGRPKRAQETPKRVQELDFGWLLKTCWAFFNSFGSFFFGPADLDFLFFGSTLKRGGTCAAHKIDVPQNLHFFCYFWLIRIVFGFARFFFEVLKT